MISNFKSFAVGAVVAFASMSLLQDKPPGPPPQEPTEQDLTKPQAAFIVRLKPVEGIEVTQQDQEIHRDNLSKLGRMSWLIILGKEPGSPETVMLAYAATKEMLDQEIAKWPAIAKKQVTYEIKPFTVLAGGKYRNSGTAVPNMKPPTSGPGSKPPG